MLVDTHILVWFALKPEELSKKAWEAMQTTLREDNKIYCLSASFWELTIKVLKGRLDLGMPVIEFHNLCARAKELEIIDTTPAHWIQSAELEWHHQDPIDRLLVATAQMLNFPLITSDQIIQSFYKHCIW